MTVSTRFLVNQENFSDTQTEQKILSSTEQLLSGQVLLKINQFAFTANNISYAAIGKTFHYWDFFPAKGANGIIPVWGFADVVVSHCEGIHPEERFYGYYPMATHLVVEPGKVSDAGFLDFSSHRKALPIIYNQYSRCSTDPIYSEKTEALQMLLRPLFTTSFLLDDFFYDNDFFGADNLVLTSASSKTALGMAFALKHNRAERKHDGKIIGLTSAANVDFVRSLHCYDEVLSYDQIKQLDSSTPTASIDFAGNGTVLNQLHNHLDQQLKYSCLVGASHWDQRSSSDNERRGPQPVLFFAPSQGEKRVGEWGGAEFQKKLATIWMEFVHFVSGWMTIETHQGAGAVERIYQQVLAGNITPNEGHILSLLECDDKPT